jgi:hypothetical protein
VEFLLTNLLEVMLLCKYTANLIKFKKKWISNGTLFDCFPFPTLAKASCINVNGIFVRVAGIVAMLTIIFATTIMDALVVVGFVCR